MRFQETSRPGGFVVKRVVTPDLLDLLERMPTLAGLGPQGDSASTDRLDTAPIAGRDRQGDSASTNRLDTVPTVDLDPQGDLASTGRPDTVPTAVVLQ
mmetsp:Transcript_1870/g.3097  ORF Transcript_1870/g.3097 Transcript_1870/m.3097 type:complete len:98 (+) Transcript_1870:191-484(+)